MPEQRKEAYILLTYPRLLPFIMAAIQLLEIAYRNGVDQIGNCQVNEESEGINIISIIALGCFTYTSVFKLLRFRH